jgi:hypothetical protein
MTHPLQLAGQALVFAAVAAFVGALSNWPRIVGMPPDEAQIKLSFVHGSRKTAECRRLTYEEIARLPPSERRPTTCGRERVAIRVLLVVDGKPLYDAVLQPSGLSRDGPAQVYQKFAVSAGKHEIIARLRDSARAEGFDYETKRDIVLKPQQNLAIDFRGDYGTFTFR